MNSPQPSGDHRDRILDRAVSHCQWPVAVRAAEIFRLISISDELRSNHAGLPKERGVARYAEVTPAPNSDGMGRSRSRRPAGDTPAAEMSSSVRTPSSGPVRAGRASTSRPSRRQWSCGRTTACSCAARRCSAAAAAATLVMSSATGRPRPASAIASTRARWPSSPRRRPATSHGQPGIQYPDERTWPRSPPSRPTAVTAVLSGERHRIGPVLRQPVSGRTPAWNTRSPSWSCLWPENSKARPAWPSAVGCRPTGPAPNRSM